MDKELSNIESQGEKAAHFQVCFNLSENIKEKVPKALQHLLISLLKSDQAWGSEPQAGQQSPARNEKIVRS